jgi:hypothetical protein
MEQLKKELADLLDDFAWSNHSAEVINRMDKDDNKLISSKLNIRETIVKIMVGKIKKYCERKT